uniref:Transmembrane protein 150C n=1 Tax=Oryzias sinensis TaxID=183150 RepID=A0A8C8A1W6_9TELE
MQNFSLWALLPPAFSIFTAGGLWAVYFISLHNEIVTPLGVHRNSSLYPPFISITGNFPPGSCFFSATMNLAAFAGSVIGFLRYLQLKNRLCRPWLNVAGLAFFSIACFGMTIVGNFQLFALMKIHDSGTLMTFGMGTLYCWLQAYITLRVNLKGEGTKVAALRFLLAGLITLCLILKFVFVTFSLVRAAQCQWALVMSFLIYVGTFGIDFRHSHFDAVCTDEAEHPEESRTSMIGQELQQL